MTPINDRKASTQPNAATMQPQIARVANVSVDAGRHEPMPRLDRDKSAEFFAEHENRPDAQSSAGSDKHDAEPTDAIAVERQKADPIRIGHHKRREQREHSESDENPAIAAILALTRAQIAGGEKRRAEKDEAHDDERDERWMRDESANAAERPNGEAELECDQSYGRDGELGIHLRRLMRRNF